MPEPDAPEVLARDVYPAAVLLEDGRVLQKVRVLVTHAAGRTARLLIFGESAAGGVRLVEELEAGPECNVPRDRSQLPFSGRIEFKTATGSVWINRDQGCGCGSPLKRMAPSIPWTTVAAVV